MDPHPVNLMTEGYLNTAAAKSLGGGHFTFDQQEWTQQHTRPETAFTVAHRGRKKHDLFSAIRQSRDGLTDGTTRIEQSLSGVTFQQAFQLLKAKQQRLNDIDKQDIVDLTLLDRLQTRQPVQASNDAKKNGKKANGKSPRQLSLNPFRN